jgi:hypothetical protein
VSEKTPAQKGRIGPGARIAVLNPVLDVVDALGLPADASLTTAEEADVVLLCVNDRAELEALVPEAVSGLREEAVLWVLFRKGSTGAGHDMSRNDVWAVAEGLGMRPLGLLSVDDTWSAFRLRLG